MNKSTMQRITNLPLTLDAFDIDPDLNRAAQAARDERNARILERTKAKFAQAAAEDLARIEAAKAGTLVDPLRQSVIEELVIEGHPREMAENLTSTQTKVIALARKYDFV